MPPAGGYRSRRRLEGLDDRAVMVVGQQLGCFGRGQPADLIDLRVGGEVPVPREGLHRPVAHDLGAILGVAVAGGGQFLPEPAGEAGLLPDLPQGAVGVALPRVGLALGQRPVVVAGSMDDEDQESARRVTAPDHAPGRPDVVALFRRHSRRVIRGCARLRTCRGRPPSVAPWRRSSWSRPCCRGDRPVPGRRRTGRPCGGYSSCPCRGRRGTRSPGPTYPISTPCWPGRPSATRRCGPSARRPGRATGTSPSAPVPRRPEWNGSKGWPSTPGSPGPPNPARRSGSWPPADPSWPGTPGGATGGRRSAPSGTPWGGRGSPG